MTATRCLGSSSFLADFEFIRFEPMVFLEGDSMVAVPIRLELLVKRNGKRIRDLEAHLWIFGPSGLVTRLHHLLDSQEFVLAAQT